MFLFVLRSVSVTHYLHYRVSALRMAVLERRFGFQAGKTRYLAEIKPGNNPKNNPKVGLRATHKSKIPKSSRRYSKVFGQKSQSVLQNKSRRQHIGAVCGMFCIGSAPDKSHMMFSLPLFFTFWAGPRWTFFGFVMFLTISSFLRSSEFSLFFPGSACGFSVWSDIL